MIDRRHLPTIHTNGTDKGELIAHLCDAAAAMLSASCVVSHTAPNARDYPGRPDDLTSRDPRPPRTSRRDPADSRRTDSLGRSH